MSLGTYPKISLKEARDKKDECKKLLSENINPISEKRVKKSSESLTLGMIIDEWLELRAKSSSDATVIQNRRMLKNITNWLGNIAIKDIKRVDIINIFSKILIISTLLISFIAILPNQFVIFFNILLF